MRPSTIPDPPTTTPVPAENPSPLAPGPADPGPPNLGLDAVALAAAAELSQETAAEEITDDQSWLVQKLRDPRTIFSFLLAIALLVFIFTRFDVHPTEIWGVIQHANLAMFGLAFLVYYSAFVLRGLRWNKLLENVGFARARGYKIPSLAGLIEIIYLSWFVNCIVPAKLGDAYRSYLLKRAAGISFSRIIGTILAERMIDIIILFGLLLISALLTFQGQVPTELNLTIAFGGLLVVVLVIGLVAMRRFGHVVERLVPGRFREKYVELQEGTLQSFRRRSLPTLISYTAMIWLLEGGRLFFVTRSLDTHIDLAVVIFIALASSLLTTLPLTPGGVGLVEGAVFVVLRTVGVDDATALSIALLDRLINYWSIVAGGIIVYIASHRK
jgi:uncharacterized protein (TIRG00374 family)